jgi:hypothetical protein
MRIPAQAPPQVRGGMCATPFSHDAIEPSDRKWKSECLNEHLILTTGGTGTPVRIFVDSACIGSEKNKDLKSVTYTSST